MEGLELAVLSACETGLGDVAGGEGTFGLQRAFHLAGARDVVASLWKVPDQQTRELMAEFYQRILRGEPRAEALRQGQRTLRTKEGGKYADPYYWGAFILQGDPGFPDLICCRPPRLVCIELKSERGVVMPSQAIWQERLAAAGPPRPLAPGAPGHHRAGARQRRTPGRGH